ncbi:MAG: hypothetical protein Q4F97_02500 [Bacteroidales bacterium]|nr:hypothetical protein [Bacteroidales bacterium]
MKKIIITALIVVLSLSIPAIFVFSDTFKITAWVFTIIDITIIAILIYSYMDDHRQNKMEERKSIISIEDIEQDEMLSICKKIAEENKMELSEALLEKINDKDEKSVEYWYKDFISQFIRDRIFPAIKENISTSTYKKMLSLTEKMSITIFKIALDNIEQGKIPDVFIERLNVEPEK